MCVFVFCEAGDGFPAQTATVLFNARDVAELWQGLSGLVRESTHTDISDKIARRSFRGQVVRTQPSSGVSHRSGGGVWRLCGDDLEDRGRSESAPGFAGGRIAPAHLRGPVGQYVLLSSVLRSLAEYDPDFQLELCELTTEEQIARLPAGGVDALFMVNALPIPGMRFEPICKERVVAMVSRHSPLARRRTISVHDLRDKKIIAQPYLWRLLEPFGIAPRILDVPHSCAVQLAYAGAGEGVALATASMMKCGFPDVVAIPFTEKLPEVQLGIAAMESNHSAALNIFRRVAVECAAAANHFLPPETHHPYVPPTVALRA
jgi:DNA-binding transcriptional LysR family regulator